MYPAGVAGVSARMVTLATGIRMRVAESGPPAGTPVLMLPGWGASVYLYRHGLDLLARRGLRVIAADMRGFGLSDHPTGAGAYSLDAYVADVTGLLDALGIDRAVVVGQSMGGGVALHFALRSPARVRAVALINPVGLVPVRWLALFHLLPRPIVSRLGGAFVPRWLVAFIIRRLAYGNPSLVTPRVIDEYWAPTQLPGFVRAGHDALVEFDWSPVAPPRRAALNAPLLVLLGRKDHLIRSDAAAALTLPNAAVHELDGGHCAHEEEPERAYALLGDFIDAVA